ncbi:hypothetical protein KCP75_05045 [Salmonella enterica subsp. enterica]|nr:hypothetical protein KCP75_05045 [Salmonella enterica subsp. enterica]
MIYSAVNIWSFAAGKARLVMTKDGKIFLNGTKIDLEGAESVNERCADDQSGTAAQQKPCRMR